MNINTSQVQKMKLINPIGRGITGGGAITPSACMCETRSSFVTGQTDTSTGKDNCWHCGCECQTSRYNVGNDAVAVRTITTSSL